MNAEGLGRLVERMSLEPVDGNSVEAPNPLPLLQVLPKAASRIGAGLTTAGGGKRLRWPNFDRAGNCGDEHEAPMEVGGAG